MPASMIYRYKNQKENYKITVMENEINKSKAPDNPIVIPDECGDSMWDAVLEQSAFVQALRRAAKIESEDKKDNQS